MPAVKAKSRKKADVQAAVKKNIQGLVAADKNRPASKRRSMAQNVAIAYSEARPTKKNRKKK